ncbi:unnamed protein product [Rotaria sordida]|uniref:Uncharacterized protein n=1 Tax=Rotaria sordida TaxID=392033 RepID=A0A813QVU0_9BILA|nr:unnamed protein product [Rotaria sordida]
MIRWVFIFSFERFSNYIGSERKIAFSGHDYALYSLSIAFIDGYIIWSDFTNHSLIRADSLDSSNKHVFLSNAINEVMTLTIYNGNNRTCVSNCNFNQHRYDPLNKRCIAGSVKCNGVYRQCSDGSDELNYDNRTCTHKQFTYNNGRCIASSHECDLDNDCGNNSDENPNQYLPCNNANHFRYNNEQCIPRSFQW